jgi:hypothetical protein
MKLGGERQTTGETISPRLILKFTGRGLFGSTASLLAVIVDPAGRMM